jgi:prophage regulatory protein
MSVKFMPLRDVIKATGLCRSAIYNGVAVGTFPKPVKLGLRAVAWVADEIESWKSKRIVERDALEAR